MKNTELEQLINEKLNSAAISDYAPNGLQVEGKETVQKIVTGVTAATLIVRNNVVDLAVLSVPLPVNTGQNESADRAEFAPDGTYQPQ